MPYYWKKDHRNQIAFPISSRVTTPQITSNTNLPLFTHMKTGNLQQILPLYFHHRKRIHTIISTPLTVQLQIHYPGADIMLSETKTSSPFPPPFLIMGGGTTLLERGRENNLFFYSGRSGSYGRNNNEQIEKSLFG